MRLNQDLQSLAEKLEGANYSVFLMCYHLQHAATADDSEVIEKCFEGVSFDRLKPIDATALNRRIRRCLSYTGDDSHGPDSAVLESEVFKQLKSQCLNQIQELYSVSLRVQEFNIRDGHPAYPVFWDFSFLFRSVSESHLLIGSSSD